MKGNVIVDKSFGCAVKLVGLYKKLSTDKREFVLSKQLLRSSTSIGANIKEAVGGVSRKGFIAKLHIACKESRETQYLIKLLIETRYLEEIDTSALVIDLEEIRKYWHPSFIPLNVAVELFIFLIIKKWCIF